MNEEEITLAPITVYSDGDMEKERHEASTAFAESSVKEVKEEAVLKDAKFVEAYRKVAAYKGKEITGTNDEEIAREGLQFVSDMIMPLTTLENEGLAGLGQLAMNADPETKQAMSYLYNTVENKETTLNGFFRGLKSVGKDPSLYAGVASGGWGFFGREAARSAVKKTLGSMLISGMATSSYMGAEEVITQEVEDIYGDKPTDWGQVQDMTSMGAIMGLAMPMAFESAVRVPGAVGGAIKEGIEAVKGGNIMSFGNGDTVGGALAGGFAGGTEALYEDMVENKDLSVEDYLARIGAGATIGAGLGKKYGGKGGTKMFVGAKPDEPGAFSNVYDKGTRKWIDDTPAEIKKTSGSSFMSQVLDHPELYKQYPELKRVKIEFKEMEKGKLGSFKPESNKIVLNKNLSEDEIKSVILHETQHGIQSLEKWAKGGSASDFADEGQELTTEGYK